MQRSSSIALTAALCIGFAALSSARSGSANATGDIHDIKASAAKKIVITEDQLQGSWIDDEKPGTYTSRWTFKKPNMTFVSYSGRVTQATYTLNGNVLIIHRAPNLMNKVPWEETMELISFRNDELTWDAGTLITLHRVP